MKNPMSDIQKLVALTAFLTQKILLLAGSALFEEEAADLDAVSQKRSQIDRLFSELAAQTAACATLSPREASRAAAFKSLGDGLRAISHDAEILAQAVSGWNRPDDKTLKALHPLHEASAILIAQAVGALVEQSNLNLQEVAHNLRHNQDRLAMIERSAPTDTDATPAILPVRNISHHARHLAETARAYLAPEFSSPSLVPRLSRHSGN